MFSQGAASQEGTVSRGDVLLSVNGAPLAGLAHGDVLKVLHQAQLHKDVLMVIRRGGDRPRPSSGQEPPTADEKSSLSRRAIPPEPGMGKTAAGQPAGVSSWHGRFWLILLSGSEKLNVVKYSACGCFLQNQCYKQVIKDPAVTATLLKI